MSELFPRTDAHPKPGTIVVKLGGSLAETPFLRNWLKVLADPLRTGIVVVPGGGVFADQVRAAQRSWKFDDRTAHCMALLAMRQFGLLLASFSPRFKLTRSVGEIAGERACRSVAVWVPDVDELDRAGIPSTWRITSDSLSAWLAGRLCAPRLVLVKAAHRSRFCADSEGLARAGVVDPAFPEYLEKSGAALTIFHASEYRRGENELARSIVSARIPGAVENSA